LPTAPKQSKRLAREAAAGETHRHPLASSHDVIAHSVSVMVSSRPLREAGLGPSRSGQTPAAAFGVIEQTGREAPLTCVALSACQDRTLRGGGAGPPAEAFSTGCAGRIRSGGQGVDVEVRIDGSQRLLAPGVELSVYASCRNPLDQCPEALGPRTTSWVANRIWARPSSAVEVNRQRRKRERFPLRIGQRLEPGCGSGVALLHGEFHAGRTGNGFHVSARVPIDPTPRDPRSAGRRPAFWCARDSRTLLGEESDIAVVAEATNGEEAIVAVDELSPDVVLMDIRMPCSTGSRRRGRNRQTHTRGEGRDPHDISNLDEYVF